MFRNTSSGSHYAFDKEQLLADIPILVRAMDNVVDRGRAPLKAQKLEAINKRRMGLGITGEANALEALGFKYGSRGYLKAREEIAELMRDAIYKASVELAIEKGAFPLFNAELYGEGKFIQTLPEDLQEAIKTHGIRNSHLLSIAPTGTISLTAGNVSSGIEPTFAVQYERTRQTFDGPITDVVVDYGVATFGNKPKVTSEVTIDEHINVLASATKYIDSAVSKTCNVNPGMPWEEFKNVYVKAWKKGCKGITTFNPGGKRYGILNAIDGVDKVEEKVEACYIDETGKKTCD